jgi:hypothetical protein
MKLDEFIQKIERERPDRLTAADLAHVTPNPWVYRAGHGKEARIRMKLGTMRYEREQGESVWRRAGDGDFDVLDDGIA